MAKRKKHSPEQIVSKLQTAERLTAEGSARASHPDYALTRPGQRHHGSLSDSALA